MPTAQGLRRCPYSSKALSPSCRRAHLRAGGYRRCAPAPVRAPLPHICAPAPRPPLTSLRHCRDAPHTGHTGRRKSLQPVLFDVVTDTEKKIASALASPACDAAHTGRAGQEEEDPSTGALRRCCACKESSPPPSCSRCRPWRPARASAT